jgi:lysophospholipase L1-like esterase
MNTYNRNRGRSALHVLYSVAATLILISSSQTLADDAAKKKPKITVFGSSVASGVAAEDNKGYWYFLQEAMEPRGWEVSCCSRGGDRTSRILDRFDDLLSHKPDYVFIGLSLANEGIRDKDEAGREAIYTQYKWGMKGLIALLRSQGIQPVVGLCYPHGYYTPVELDFVNRMNLLVNSWDVPSVNFMGTLDDTSGGWAAGYVADPWHPNTNGHKEMFYAFVPSLFEAMKAGKSIPAKASGDGYATLGGNYGSISFEQIDTIHSWAVSIEIRSTSQNKVLALIGPNKITMDDNGAIGYHSETAGTLVSLSKSNDDIWHHIVVSHLYAHGQTFLYVDGKKIGALCERVDPSVFTIGPEFGTADYREWMIYRAALNDMEVKALHEGTLLQASLELYAPLEETDLQIGKPVENRAQSLSEAKVSKGMKDRS